MDSLLEDAQRILKILPWIGSDEEIINFMRRVPLDKYHLKNQLTLRYFLKRRDSQEENAPENLEDDIWQIVVLSPETPYQVIKKQFSMLGNIPNRKEIVLRQILRQKNDLDEILAEMDSFRKRRSKPYNCLASDDNDNSETDIKIKIRKIQGSLEVVSSIKQENSQRMKYCINQQIDEQVPPPSITMAHRKKNLYLDVPAVYANNNNSDINEVPNFNLVKHKKGITQTPTAVINNVIRTKDMALNKFPKTKYTNQLVDKNENRVDQTQTIPQTSKAFKLKPSVLFNNPPKPKLNFSMAPPKLEIYSHMRENDDPNGFEHKPHTIIKSEENEGVDQEEVQPSTSNSKPSTSKSNPVPIKNRQLIEALVLRLIEIFPQSDPEFLRDVCDGKTWSDFDNVVTTILSLEDHPKRPEREPTPPKQVDFEEQFEIVKALLPDADPDYLRMQCQHFWNDINSLNEFINDARESRNYPTYKEYLRKQQLSAQSKQYTTEFDVENFVKLFPDPMTTFRDSQRKVELDNYSKLYLMSYFYNKYNKLAAKTIKQILIENNFRAVVSDEQLNMAMQKKVMKTRRKHYTLPEPGQNILVLQEIAYLDHKEEIEELIEGRKKKEEEDKRFAKKNQLMNTCQCCFDEEVMPKDTFTCPKSCLFCRECVKRSCEIALGDRKFVFACLNNCSEEFSLHTLQNALPPKLFSKLAQKKALAEIAAAGIEELEMCPFCDFATIPNENDKIFRCLNPECMKESCRQCKESNHIPLKCDEIEKDEDVKARVYVENEMTEALLRKCWKCGTRFFKEEGCNLMTCNCGAKMCYLCKKPVNDYKHFNGIGGDKFELCQLYSDTNQVNAENVMQAATKAKSQVDPSKLKVDPSMDVKEHFDNRKKVLPNEPHLELMRDFRQHLDNLQWRARRVQLLDQLQQR